MNNHDASVKGDRDITFDILKGFGILLMLCGHYWPGSHWAHQVIYSFHMPLFFLVAGYFSKPVTQGGAGHTIKKNAKRLLLPFVATQLLLVAWGGIQAMAKHDVSYVLKPSLSLLWGSCDVLDSQWGLIYVGPMWFLPALFWAKTAFECLASKLREWTLLLVCVIVSVASMVLHVFTNSPWCLLQGLSCLTFVAMGYLAKQKLFPRWTYWIALLCWPVAIVFSSIEVADCTYHLYPLDVLGACGGTLFVWWWSSKVTKIGALSRVLAWFGVNSMLILCFHNFEWFSSISYSVTAHIPFDVQGNWMILLRFSLTLVLVFLAIYTPFVRDVYGARTVKR
jgi:fucose 4-O-acetylase-like acetyltransferase